MLRTTDVVNVGQMDTVVNEPSFFLIQAATECNVTKCSTFKPFGGGGILVIHHRPMNEAIANKLVRWRILNGWIECIHP